MLFLGLNVYQDDDINTLSERERFIWDVNWLQTEWYNGGTAQVFRNHTGCRIGPTIAALAVVGATESAAVLRQASDLFPEGRPSVNYEFRWEQMDEVHRRSKNAFDQFDQRMLKEDVFGLLLDYWRKHDSSPDAEPDSLRRKREAYRLFIDIPLTDEADYATLLERERYLWDICFFDALSSGKGNVSNFFASPNGAHALGLLTALQEIGAVQTGNVVQKVCSLYPGGRPSSDMLERMRQNLPVVDAAKSLFGNVEIKDGVVRHDGWEENLFALLVEYWHKHDE
jgi:hypothetical protein